MRPGALSIANRATCCRRPTLLPAWENRKRANTGGGQLPHAAHDRASTHCTRVLGDRLAARDLSKEADSPAPPRKATLPFELVLLH